MNEERKSSIDSALRSWAVAAAVAMVAIVFLILLAPLATRPRHSSLTDCKDAATFVGSQECRECHAPEYEKWTGSDHDQAMAVADSASVRGDFDNVIFDDGIVRVRFFTDAGRYLVNALGPDGKVHDYQVTHTFGWRPLQQYLIPFPGGRYQCLNVAWDTEKKQWFNLYPSQAIPVTDWLYWTRGGQNWNGMCAECHSTNLKKNYDSSQQNFDTTWSEINVGCEACHGPGSDHVKWARVPAMARKQDGVRGLMVQTSSITSQRLVEICAPCHSRRSEIGDYNHANAHLLDVLLPSVLEEGLYYPDGQILGEDYVYGSFTQSKMYHRDVRCSDCHDPHGLQLHFEGNALCEQCHRAEDYDTPSHHFHKDTYEGKPSKAVLCISCHMPKRTYMVVDPRADHSLRIPRPDLTASIGVPNACSQEACHADRPLQWVVDAFTKWYGSANKPHYGVLIAAGQQGVLEAGPQLARLSGNTLYPSIVRATALTLLDAYPGQESTEAFNLALSDENPLVRYTSAAHVSAERPERLVELLVPLLFDPVRGVRAEAASRLAGVSSELLKAYQQEALARGIEEFEESMRLNLDFPHAGFNLGNLYTALGELKKAEKYYRMSLDIDAIFLPAMANLAQLLNREGRNDEANELLARAVTAYPQNGDLLYSQGLLLAEMKRYTEAEQALSTAVPLLPSNPAVHTNRALILEQLNRHEEAEQELKAALKIDPATPKALFALADLYVRTGRLDEARTMADELLRRSPNDPNVHRLVDVLNRMRIHPRKK